MSRASRCSVEWLALGPFWIAAATAIGRATGMPPSDARETGANARIPRVAAGRRASETTQCARHHSAARHLVSDGKSARSLPKGKRRRFRWYEAKRRLRVSAPCASQYAAAGASFALDRAMSSAARAMHAHTAETPMSVSTRRRDARKGGSQDPNKSSQQRFLSA